MEMSDSRPVKGEVMPDLDQAVYACIPFSTHWFLQYGACSCVDMLPMVQHAALHTSHGHAP